MVVGSEEGGGVGEMNCIVGICERSHGFDIQDDQ